VGQPSELAAMTLEEKALSNIPKTIPEEQLNRFLQTVPEKGKSSSTRIRK
jgi:hypothetical protein